MRLNITLPDGQEVEIEAFAVVIETEKMLRVNTRDPGIALIAPATLIVNED